MTDENLIAKQIAEYEAQLQSTPAYRKLLILKETAERLAAVDRETQPGPAKPHSVATQSRQFGGPRGKVSVLAAVHEALRAAGEPLTTNQLLEIIPQYGAESGGSDPKKNLVSQLSGNKTPLSRELESVQWNGWYAWWFKGISTPKENTAGSASNDPAASSTENKGGPNGTALGHGILPAEDKPDAGSSHR